MEKIIYNLVMLVVMIVAALVSRYLIPILKSQIGAQNYDMIYSLVEDAVLMAQQVMEQEPGEDRKKFVMRYALDRLEEYGLKVDEELISVMVEAAVKRMKLAGGE